MLRMISTILVIILLAAPAVAQDVRATDWPGYNAPDRVRADILILRDDGSPAVRELISRMQAGLNSRDVFSEAFRAVQRGELRRMPGCVSVRMTLSGAILSGRYFEYRYPDSSKPEDLARPQTVLPAQGPESFVIQGCDGYASLDMPYDAAQVQSLVTEMSIIGHQVSFPTAQHDGFLRTEPGEWARFVQREEQWAGFVFIVRP